MYNYCDDPAVFQRNAAIAMGSSGDERFLPHLRAELTNTSPIVRSHVTWAIEKLS
jgi:epoxyqueuosine reductase QueG